MGMPRSASWLRSSVWAMPEVATLLKIEPISCMVVPEAAAELATFLSMSSSSWPGWMPAATAEAATVAASPRPNAVPFTEADALSMIAATVSASLPRPRSLAWAVSIAFSRLNPEVSAVARTAPPAATAAVAAVWMPVPIACPTEDAAEPTEDAIEAMPDVRVDRMLETAGPIAVPILEATAEPTAAAAAPAGATAARTAAGTCDMAAWTPPEILAPRPPTPAVTAGVADASDACADLRRSVAAFSPSAAVVSARRADASRSSARMTWEEPAAYLACASASCASATRTLPAVSCCLSRAAETARAAAATSCDSFFSPASPMPVVAALKPAVVSFPRSDPMPRPLPWKAFPKPEAAESPALCTPLETAALKPVITGKMATWPEPT